MADTKAFLNDIGARPVRSDRDWYVLDGFSHDCYLVFDGSECPEAPEGTIDLYVSRPGSQPLDSDERILVAPNLTRLGVMRFMVAMGVEQFSEQTRRHLANHVVCPQ